MKILIVVFGYLVLSLPSQGRVRPYLQDLVKEHGLTELAATYMWRRYFTNKAALVSFDDYVAEQLNVKDLVKMEQAGRREEVARLASDQLSQWLQEFYPPPTEARLLEVLGEDPVLRSRLTALTLIMSRLKSGNQWMPDAEVFARSLGVALFIQAIDADMTSKALQRQLNSFIEGNTLDITYVGDGRFDFVPVKRKTAEYQGREDYLLRANHVMPTRLFGSEVLSELWAHGYVGDQANLIKLFPVTVAREVTEQGVSPSEDGNISGYDPAVYIDILIERGIIGDFSPSVFQIEASVELEDRIAEELGLGLDSKEFEQVIDILHDSSEPASFFQIVQLSRLGYSLEEIAQLSYYAREAVIVSGYGDRASFVNAHGTDMEALNESEGETGPLVFYLLREGYVRDVKDINPHRQPSPKEVQHLVTENEWWASLISGRVGFAIVESETTKELRLVLARVDGATP